MAFLACCVQQCNHSRASALVQLASLESSDPFYAGSSTRKSLWDPGGTIGLQRDLTAATISGAKTNAKNELIFLVRWVGDLAEPEFALAREARRRWPMLVINSMKNM